MEDKQEQYIFNELITDKESALRKILIISYYFPPMGLSGVQRTLKFVKYLPEYDWQPLVLTTGTTSYYAFDETLFSDVKDSNLIKIYRTEKDPFQKNNSECNTIKEYPSPWKQKLGHLLLQSFFIPDSRIKWKKEAIKLGEQIIAEHPDIKLIFATAPPFTDFLVAKELSAKYDIPFVVDYRDLWSDNPQYYFPTPYHKRKHISLEKSVLHKASKIFVITRNMKERLIDRYRFLSHYDISIISHGYDIEDFIPYKNIKPNPNKLTITHCGLFPDDRTPKYFLQALSNFLDKYPEARKNIEARFVGIMRMAHIKMITKYKLNDVANITGYLSHSDSVKNLMESDILWMMLPNNLETPGRFFEYIGAKKTMLISIPDGSMKQIAEKSNAAFLTNYKDVNEIFKVLEKIYSLWKQKKLPIPDDNFVIKFDRKRLTKLLAKEISFIAKD